MRNPSGKVLGKVVSDLTTFTYKGCKIAAQKKVFFWANFDLLSRIYLVSVLLSILVERFFVSHMKIFQSIGPLGPSMPGYLLNMTELDLDMNGFDYKGICPQYDWICLNHNWVCPKWEWICPIYDGINP